MQLPDELILYEGDLGYYPTEEFLEWIEKVNVFEYGKLNYLKTILDTWYHSDYGWKIKRKYNGKRKVFISTLGWSGNEEMIAAMKENVGFWHTSYYQHERGGHYTFIINE